MTGDFRSPAFVQKNADGSYCADLRYVSCEVCKGKYQIPGLPAAYDETGAESETLKVYLEDAPGDARVTLLYGVFAELDIITRAVQITNCGTEAVHVEKAAILRRRQKKTSMSRQGLSWAYPMRCFRGN